MSFIKSYKNFLLEYYKPNQFGDFFSKVSSGERDTSNIDYNPLIDLSNIDKIERIVNAYRRYNKGHFDDHISKSIPGHKDIQIITANAVVKLLKKKKGSNVLDIGGSEGSWAKTITNSSNDRIKTTILDPNETMKKMAEKDIPDETSFISKDFNTYQPKLFDIVHESMTFQFISDKRFEQIQYVKDNLLKPGGIFLTEEKVLNPDWDENERLKDIFKSIYFEKDILKKKSKDILKGGMNKLLVDQKYLESSLRSNFKYVHKYWDGGNFKGYMASDKNINIEKLKRYIPPINNFRDQISSYLKTMSN